MAEVILRCVITAVAGFGLGAGTVLWHSWRKRGQRERMSR